MTVASSASAPPHFRFTLSGLFLFMFGIGLGLSHRRFQDVRWPDAMLAACAAWIIVGMLQQARQTWLRWRLVDRQPTEFRWSFMLDLIRILVVICMLALVNGTQLSMRLIYGTAEQDLATYPDFYWEFESLNFSLFFLAAICAYWPWTSNGRQNSRPPRKALRAAFDLIALILGALWLLYVLRSALIITGLVHIAIRGVELAQPTRWAGHSLYPAHLDDGLSHQFISRAILASICLSIAATFTIVLARCWDRRKLRPALLGTAIFALGIVAWLACWWWKVGYPGLSPFLAAHSGTPSWSVLVTGCALVFTAGLALVLRVVPQRVNNQLPYLQASPAGGYHFSAIVMTLFVIGAVGGGTPTWWSASSALLPSFQQTALEKLFELLQYWLYEPAMLLRLAAVLIVGRRLWRTLRGTDVPHTEFMTVKPAKLFTVWLLAAFVLVLAVPVGTWLGFVLVVYPPELQ